MKSWTSQTDPVHFFLFGGRKIENPRQHSQNPRKGNHNWSLGLRYITVRRREEGGRKPIKWNFSIRFTNPFDFRSEINVKPLKNLRLRRVCGRIVSDVHTSSETIAKSNAWRLFHQSRQRRQFMMGVSLEGTKAASLASYFGTDWYACVCYLFYKFNFCKIWVPH